MKLILYSTDGHEKNELIDAEVVDLLDKSATITFIPSSTDHNRKYFNKFKDWYGGLGYKNINYFDLDKEYDPAAGDVVLKSNAIYLSGGDTNYFLDTILKRGFRERLISFVKHGGVLIGVSAGSILTAPIYMDKPALGLVNFEFLPHYENAEKYPQPELLEQKVTERSKSCDVIACRDGEGLIIWEDDKFIIGEPVLFFMGNKELLERF